MRHPRLLRAAAIATPVLLLAGTATAEAASAPSGAGGLTSAQAAALSQHVTDKVIVVFKNQVASVPDTAANVATRMADVKAAQAGVMAQLTATHATNVKSFSLINAVSATVSPGEAKELAANPAVSMVTPDLPIPLAGATPAVPAAKPAAGITPLPGACAASGKVQLDPEALGNIHAAGPGQTAQSLGYTGAGVKVAFIADGVDPDNPDFIRANGQHVFVDNQDFSGTGTNAPTDGGEAFLDSSSIAAQGRHVYDVSSYGEGLSTPCKIRILGVAPGASLVGLNVFGSSDFAFSSVFLEAINYAVQTDHVNVLNESFGANPFPDTGTLDLTRMADDAAVKAGVTVTVSSGDAGPTDTIGSPATDPLMLSAGASTTYRSYAQTGIGGITTPGVKGWLDNNISGLSSGGFDQTGGTVDVVAPGDLNWALCTPKPTLFAACVNFAGQPASVELSGGTSEAAPLTAGTAALVIQAYRKTHGGATPSPAVVKQIIVSTAQNIDAPADQQGAGILDADAAVRAAASFHGATTAPAGQATLDGTTQFNAVGQPGTTEHFGETFTNDGASTETLGLSSRTLSKYTPVATKRLSLTAAANDTTTVTFTVPKGQARLNASVALVGTANLSLISPRGDLAEYNLPQGTGNYGNAQVADPAAGTWTAVVSTTSTASSVPASFQASTATWRRFGSLSTSSLKIAPGASASATLTVHTPRRAGDEAGSIMVDNSAATAPFAAVTSVPVTLRSLVPSPSSTVTGVLTGGNGRDPDTGQTAYYELDVPSGLKALNLDVSTHDPANTLLAALINPDGAAVSSAANDLLSTTSAGGTTLTPETGAQLHTLAPAAGRWTVVVDFFGTVSGTAVAQPYKLAFSGTPVTASASGLPDSASTQLAAGKRVTVKVRVTNHGTSPEAYFTDARLSSQTTVSLAAQGASSSVTLPDLTGTVPTYLVPSHTTAIASQVSGSKPLFYDFAWAFGDPDLISTTGTTATGSYSAAAVPDGDWGLTPFLVGPTGAAPAPSITAASSMTATTAPFDPAASSPTGDLWTGAVSPSAGFTPYVVDPGKSVTIPVTIRPSGKAGSTVSGTLYLSDSSFVPAALSFDDLTQNLPEGSDVAAFPYRYTIK